MIMETIIFADWEFDVDPHATRNAYARIAGIDVSCCDACAAMQSAVELRTFPSVVTSLLERCGVDVAKPQDVSGVPEEGLLDASWQFVGQLRSAEWDGGSERAFAEPTPGFQCWITGKPSMSAAPAFGDQPTLQFEFMWNMPAGRLPGPA